MWQHVKVVAPQQRLRHLPGCEAPEKNRKCPDSSGQGWGSDVAACQSNSAAAVTQSPAGLQSTCVATAGVRALAARGGVSLR